ncbi:hypothetical protein [Treponema succinifaciens]|uniref:hypothetical protein n=1 Tax=Treponema succinifaciens TaxID=167 RepID=UPI0023F81851|nr:hypothetical protein [Treponema succinifaciens]
MKPGSDAARIATCKHAARFCQCKTRFFTSALFAHGLACGKDWNTCGAVPKRSGGMSRG